MQGLDLKKKHSAHFLFVLEIFALNFIFGHVSYIHLRLIRSISIIRCNFQISLVKFLN